MAARTELHTILRDAAKTPLLRMTVVCVAMTLRLLKRVVGATRKMFRQTLIITLQNI
jgi:hypothetical protein